MPKRVDPNESFMVERREKAQKWMAENGKKYKLTSRQQALDINNNMNNYYVLAPWKAYNKHKLCNQLFGVQLEWLQELLEIQGYTGKLSIVSWLCFLICSFSLVQIACMRHSFSLVKSLLLGACATASPW